MTDPRARSSEKAARIAAADREHELDEIVPIMGEASSEDDAARQAQALPPLPSLYAVEDYFAPRGFMDASVKEHRVIVSWYVMACGLLARGINEAQIYEGEPDHFVNFRSSYAGWCNGHGISPEQGQTWDALYRCLRLTGHRDFPTLDTFLRATSTSAVRVNEG